MSRNESRLFDWLGNWRGCLFKRFAQNSNTAEQCGLVILVSDVIGSFVNKGAVVHTDKEPDWQVNEEEEWGTRVLFYCCLKELLMNYLLEHESVKVPSLLDPYSAMHTLHINKYTKTQRRAHTEKSHPFGHIGKPLNTESTWSWGRCGEARSKNSYHTHTHTHTHIHTLRLHTMLSIIDFLVKTARKQSAHDLLFSEHLYEQRDCR